VDVRGTDVVRGEPDARHSDRVGLAFVATDGTLLRADAVFCELAGIEASEAVGRNVIDVWPDLDLTLEIETASQICRGDATYTTLFRRYPAPGGGEWDVEVGIFGVRDPDGRSILSVRLRGIGAEVPRPEVGPLPPEDDETLMAFDQGKVGALIIGLDGRARRVNPAMCRICGRTAEEMTAVDLLALTHPDDQGRDVELSLQVWTGDSDGWSHEKRLLRPDGSIVWVQQEVAVVRDADGRPHHFLAQAVDITDRKEAEAELRESRERIELLTSGLPVGLLEVSATGAALAANPALVELVGFDPVEQGIRLVDLIDPEHVDAVVERFLESVADGEDWSSDFRLAPREGGRARWVRAFVRSHFEDDGSFRSATGAWFDVTDEMEARSESARFGELLADVPDFVAIASTDGRVVYRNPAAATVIPLATDDALELIALFDEKSQERLLLDVVPAIEATGAWSGELTLVGADGARRPVLASMTLHGDDSAEVEYVTVIARDIADLKAVEDLLREQATQDSLTGLVNRTAFHQAVEAALAREPGAGALLFVDLDRFKGVNDRFGHEAGDAVLVEVAERLRRAVRDGDVVGRIGGDEFVVLCRGRSSPADVAAVAARIVERLAQPIGWEGTPLVVGASVGVAMAGGDDDARSLIRRADGGVYLAKRRGGSQVAEHLPPR
jgi:diguanylate cyclase (GGDEF)-like protein/PAS domain S-box-containing protein